MDQGVNINTVVRNNKYFKLAKLTHGNALTLVSQSKLLEDMKTSRKHETF